MVTVVGGRVGRTGLTPRRAVTERSPSAELTLCQRGGGAEHAPDVLALVSYMHLVPSGVHKCIGEIVKATETLWAALTR